MDVIFPVVQSNNAIDSSKLTFVFLMHNRIVITTITIMLSATAVLAPAIIPIIAPVEIPPEPE